MSGHSSCSKEDYNNLKIITIIDNRFSYEEIICV